MNIYARVRNKIDFVDTDGCWLWLGYKTKAGYGQTFFKNKVQLAHRVLYTLLIGPIPTDRELDHLCKTPSCVNPLHLEPVTSRENIVRRVPKLTTCPKGHSYNTNNFDGKYRRCRQCHNDQEYRRRQDKRSESKWLTI